MAKKIYPSRLIPLGAFHKKMKTDRDLNLRKLGEDTGLSLNAVNLTSSMSHNKK